MSKIINPNEAAIDIFWGDIIKESVENIPDRLDLIEKMGIFDLKQDINDNVNNASSLL